MKAERETADRLIAHFLADRIGATFDGHISGVTRAGLFVELDETGADGLIPARFIGDEYFRFNEAGRAFVGSSATYRLGDPVTVELVEAAPVAGALRFGCCMPTHAPRQRSGLDIKRRAQRKLSRQSKPIRTSRQKSMNDDPEPMVGRGSADDRAERLTRTIRDQTSPNLRPRDSATLILIDRSEAVPKVLLGTAPRAASLSARQVRVSRRAGRDQPTG